MTEWSLNASLSKRHFVDVNLVGTGEELCKRVEEVGQKLGYTLEVDGFTDQMEFFYRDRSGHRRRFVTLMAEG